MPQHDLRNYQIDRVPDRVLQLYRDMYRTQTHAFAKRHRETLGEVPRGALTIHEMLDRLDHFIDPSDPDVAVPNSVHAYQTAEAIRQAYPENTELQVIGLIHDLGKILFDFGYPPHAVVGDTFVTGCRLPECCVLYDEAARLHPEFHAYDQLGVYSAGCGLDRLVLSFGHDEYLYRVLERNRAQHSLSQRGMRIIRYHSLYPWHSGDAYTHFMSAGDEATLKDVREFNAFDLYSKPGADAFVVTDSMREYYRGLLDTYFTGPIKL